MLSATPVVQLQCSAQRCSDACCNWLSLRHCGYKVESSLVSYRPLALKKTNLIVPVMRSSVSLLAEISSLRHTRNRRLRPREEPGHGA